MNANIVLDNILSIFAPLMFLSFALIALYLVKNGLYTWWGIGTSFMWPKLILDYKAHTKNMTGRVGIFYYIFVGSLFVTLTAIIASLGIHLANPY